MGCGYGCRFRFFYVEGETHTSQTTAEAVWLTSEMLLQGLTELLVAGVYLRLQVLASGWLLCTTQAHSSICLFPLKS